MAPPVLIRREVQGGAAQTTGLRQALHWRQIQREATTLRSAGKHIPSVGTVAALAPGPAEPAGGQGLDPAHVHSLGLVSGPRVLSAAEVEHLLFQAVSGLERPGTRAAIGRSRKREGYMPGGSFHTQHPGGKSTENGLVVAGVGGRYDS